MGGAKRQLPKRLPAKLRLIREALGYTQEEMIKRLGLEGKVPRSYLSRFETGEREPSLDVLLRYSKIAGVWINALVDDGVDLPTKLPCGKMHEGVKRGGR
jgi:transcriptional regulator with XRE-family HTH domain